MNEITERKTEEISTDDSFAPYVKIRRTSIDASILKIIEAIDDAHAHGYMIHYEAVADACLATHAMLLYVKKTALQQLKHADCSQDGLDIEYAKLITYCNQARNLASTFERDLRKLVKKES